LSGIANCFVDGGANFAQASRFSLKLVFNNVTHLNYVVFYSDNLQPQLAGVLSQFLSLCNRVERGYDSN